MTVDEIGISDDRFDDPSGSLGDERLGRADRPDRRAPSWPA